MKKVVFFGQEKNRDTIHIAKMNLAVHGLDGKIAEAITYYQDEHTLTGMCDFVMANPPFNVDLVDAERIKGDPRLPFDLPGVNKQKRVGNGNYLWISYFWSYLNPKGRAGFVMSSQASSAGHGEKEVRQKIVETGDVDVMISIRSNFFYTRTVPCELWFFDRAKPAERRDRVLMLDARNVYRKVTRKIYDFSPEQMQNLAAIVWLYRGQRERFLALVRSYLDRICQESAAIPAAFVPFERTFADLQERFAALAKAVRSHPDLDREKKQSPRRCHARAGRSRRALRGGREGAAQEPGRVRQEVCPRRCPRRTMPSMRRAPHFDPLAESLRGFVKQADLLYKLAARVADLGGELATDDVISAVYDRRATARLVKQCDEERKAAVEQVKRPAYFHRAGGVAPGTLPQGRAAAGPGPGQAGGPERDRGRRLEPDPGPLRRRRPARGRCGFRLRADDAGHPHRAGRPQPRGGGAGGGRSRRTSRNWGYEYRQTHGFSRRLRSSSGRNQGACACRTIRGASRRQQGVDRPVLGYRADDRGAASGQDVGQGDRGHACPRPSARVRRHAGVLRAEPVEDAPVLPDLCREARNSHHW